MIPNKYLYHYECRATREPFEEAYRQSIVDFERVLLWLVKESGLNSPESCICQYIISIQCE